MYTVTVKISEIGTRYTDPKDPHKSFSGHMWYSLSDGTPPNESYGFAPDPTALAGPGKVTRDDDAYYFSFHIS